MGQIRTKKLKTINEKTLIATVDLGKISNMGYWRCPNGTEAKPFEFSNNHRGFMTFWNHISAAKERYGLSETVVGFESTGCYGEPLLHFLRAKKVPVVQVNPMHTKRLKELQGNSPNKTDRKDPKVIADIIGLGHSLTLVVPEGPAAELRRLTQARERSLQRRTALFNQLQKLVFVIFPEYSQVMKDVKTKSSQYLLKHFPTPQSILQCGLSGLTETLRRVSRGKLGKARARMLYAASRESVGIREGRESILLEISEILSQLASLQGFIVTLEGKMSYYLEEIPSSRYLLSMKGIGKITAAGLYGEVGDFSKFRTIAEITKLAGLDLYELSSGKHQGNRHISKRGRPLMRKLLYFAALNTVRKSGVMHARYHSYLARGMLRQKALVAIARKILRVIFSLVRNHREFILEETAIPILQAA